MNATHTAGELAEIANRVLGFVRARQLLSNVDPEEIAEVVINLGGWGPGNEPKPFRLLSSDLEALAAAHIEPRCAGRVQDTTGVTETRVCGLTLNADGRCPRPELDHVR